MVRYRSPVGDPGLGFAMAEKAVPRMPRITVPRVTVRGRASRPRPRRPRRPRPPRRPHRRPRPSPETGRSPRRTRSPTRKRPRRRCQAGKGRSRTPTCRSGWRVCRVGWRRSSASRAGSPTSAPPPRCWRCWSRPRRSTSPHHQGRGHQERPRPLQEPVNGIQGPVKQHENSLRNQRDAGLDRPAAQQDLRQKQSPGRRRYRDPAEPDDDTPRPERAPTQKNGDRPGTGTTTTQAQTSPSRAKN